MKRLNNLYYSNDEIPSIKFEQDWKFIEEKYPNNLLILKKAPNYTAYFMKKGIILGPEKIKIKKNKDKLLCFKVDANYLLEDDKC